MACTLQTLYSESTIILLVLMLSSVPTLSSSPSDDLGVSSPPLWSIAPSELPPKHLTSSISSLRRSLSTSTVSSLLDSPDPCLSFLLDPTPSPSLSVIRPFSVTNQSSSADSVCILSTSVSDQGMPSTGEQPAQITASMSVPNTALDYCPSTADSVPTSIEFSASEIIPSDSLFTPETTPCGHDVDSSALSPLTNIDLVLAPSSPILALPQPAVESESEYSLAKLPTIPGSPPSPLEHNPFLNAFNTSRTKRHNMKKRSLSFHFVNKTYTGPKRLRTATVSHSYSKSTDDPPRRTRSHSSCLVSGNTSNTVSPACPTPVGLPSVPTRSEVTPGKFSEVRRAMSESVVGVSSPLRSSVKVAKIESEKEN